MNKENLIKEVQTLAEKWGLNNPKKQELKIFEEFGELCKAELEGDLEEIKDGIGDVLITIILWASIKGIDPIEFINSLIDNISISYEFQPPIHVTSYVFSCFTEIIAKHNIDPWECLQKEFEKVNKREGKTINGTFIKNK